MPPKKQDEGETPKGGRAHTSFKNYDAQQRLLAATIAAHPELKLNYRQIAEHMGSGHSTSAVEHRFRPVRKVAELLRAAVNQGVDTKDLDVSDPNEIARLYGSSSADGIQYQFRQVKKEAQLLVEDSVRGTNTAFGGIDPNNPGKKSKAGGSRATPSKRKAEDAIDEDPKSSPDDEMDITPAKKPKARAVKGEKTFVKKEIKQEVKKEGSGIKAEPKVEKAEDDEV